MLVNLGIHGRFTIGEAPGESLLTRTLFSSRGRVSFDGPVDPGNCSHPAEQTAEGILAGWFAE